MFCDRKRMELFSSPGDISIHLDGDRHTRGDAIPESFVHCKVYALYLFVMPHFYGWCNAHSFIKFMQIFELQEEEMEHAVTYTVASQSSQMSHTVTIIASECPQGKGCIPQCTKANCLFLCRHMIRCTCYDYSHGHLCKHVHKVQSMQRGFKNDSLDGTGKVNYKPIISL